MITRIVALVAVVGTSATLASPEITDDELEIEECPEAFRGASVTAKPITDGVALLFTTEARHVVEMREELRDVAMLLEQHATEQQTASYDEEVDFPPVDLDVVNIRGGAKVLVRASRPRDLPELRDIAFAFEQFWKSSACNGDIVARR